jgi:hypothetical protein
MSFEDDIAIPDELRDDVSRRLKSTGVLKKITHNVKVGLTAAIGEIKGERQDSKAPKVKSVLDHEGLCMVDRPEKLALQGIYRFLKEHALRYTFETLMEESTVDPRDSGIDLFKLFFLKDAVFAPAEDEDDD